MALNRIHIVGAPGSGKTWLSSELGRRFEIPIHDLDDIFWDHESDNYRDKTPEAERQRRLDQLTSQARWIVEGVYFRWVNSSFQRADLIIVLETPMIVRDFRIVRRFISRRRGNNYVRKESLTSLTDLIGYNHRYEHRYYSELNGLLKGFHGKVCRISRSSDATSMISQISGQMSL